MMKPSFVSRSKRDYYPHPSVAENFKMRYMHRSNCLKELKSMSKQLSLIQPI
jgi:hypothetical protein